MGPAETPVVKAPAPKAISDLHKKRPLKAYYQEVTPKVMAPAETPVTKAPVKAPAVMQETIS